MGFCGGFLRFGGIIGPAAARLRNGTVDAENKGAQVRGPSFPAGSVAQALPVGSLTPPGLVLKVWKSFCPHRLVAQDVGFSARKPGFDSPWGYLYSRISRNHGRYGCLSLPGRLLSASAGN